MSVAYGIEDLLEVDILHEENFLKIRETLQRIGVPGKENRLFQSCHILQKKGRYFITHFKELFLLDGKDSEFSEEDKGRRNRIASLLDEWQLLRIVDKEKAEKPLESMQKIKVVPFRDRSSWEFVVKYTIGNKNNLQENFE